MAAWYSLSDARPECGPTFTLVNQTIADFETRLNTANYGDDGVVSILTDVETASEVVYLFKLEMNIPTVEDYVGS